MKEIFARKFAENLLTDLFGILHRSHYNEGMKRWHRRGGLLLFFFLLVCALSWHPLLSFCIREAVQLKTGSTLSFREMRIQEGKIVLEDAHLKSQQDVELFCQKVLIHLSLTNVKSLQLIRPHVVFSKGVSLESFTAKGGGKKISIEVIEGSFEVNGSSPLKGTFSFQDRKLNIGSEGGFLSVAALGSEIEKTYECTFEEVPLAPMALFLPFLSVYPVDGTLNGCLHVAKDKTSGRLKINRSGWLCESWDTALGLGCLEVEGEADLGFESDSFRLASMRRLKLEVEDAFAVRKSSRIEELFGVLFYNEGVGFRWELKGKDFSWLGKSFVRQQEMEWLQSRLAVGSAEAHLDMETVQEEGVWTLSLSGADAPFYQWAADFSPYEEWPCRLREGVLDATLIYKGGDRPEWGVSSFKGKDLLLSSSNWLFSCKDVSGFAASIDNERMGFDGELSLQDSRFSFQQLDVADLSCHLSIQKGEIQKSWIRAICNGLQTNGELFGSLQEALIQASVKGPWKQVVTFAGLESKELSPFEASLTLKGDWDAFTVSASLPFSDEENLQAALFVDRQVVQTASLEATRFSLSRINPLWSGRANASVSYADGNWNGKGGGSDLFFKDGAATFKIQQVEGIFAIEEGRLSASAKQVQGEISYLGEIATLNTNLTLEDQLLTASIESGNVAGIQVQGECLISLENERPFSIQATYLNGDLDKLAKLASLDLTGKIAGEGAPFTLNGAVSSAVASWNWSLSAHLFDLCFGAIQNGSSRVSLDSTQGLLSLSDLGGKVQIGDAQFSLRGSAYNTGKDWKFDLRLEDEFLDLVRLSGLAQKERESLSCYFDPVKTHILGLGVDVHECRAALDSWEMVKLSTKATAQDLRGWRRSLLKINRRLEPLLDASIDGAFTVEMDLRKNGLSLIRINGDRVLWNQKEIPFHCALLQTGWSWKVEDLQVGDLFGEASLSCIEDGWQIDSGVFRYQENSEAHISGWIDSDFKCELCLDSLSIALDQLSDLALEGRVEGKGSVSAEWRDEFCYDIDCDLSLSPLKIDSYSIENATPLQLHVSKRQGLLIRGLDLSVKTLGEDPSYFYGKIGLMQYDFHESCWHLHHSYLRLPTDSFSLLLQKMDANHPLASFLTSLDPKQDLECFTEISFTKDYSRFSCFMKEGFIPLLGAVRHFQNVDFQYGGNEASLDVLALHQGHSFKIGARVELDKMAGRVTLEDEEMPIEEGEKALALHWEVHPEKGLLFHSIEGRFGELEASFHQDVRAEKTSLIGSLKVDFAYLSELIPPRIGRVFNELKMGKGYELKGRLFYGPGHADFKGLLSGKNCELCGWQIRSLLSQVEISPSFVHLFELKGSDAAGILKIDQLMMEQEGDAPWSISMPSFKLLEFRPSLLQKVGREVGPVGPLVVRELELKNFQGELEESITYTADGALSFINSFKREHTVFDIPADVLGRIFGLDLELLIPVKGRLSFALKEGKFWLNELHGAYSEGKRSKFFLVQEGVSPTVDLDGNINILVKMKQYVLFKFTENFLLSIDGTLGNPSYSLQKKSRIQKLSGI